MSPTPKPVDPELLTIRERRTLGGPGGAELRQTVDCPRRASAVDVQDCMHCGHGQVTWTHKPTAAQVQCSHPRERMPNARRTTVEASALVKFVMSPHVVCVREDASLESIATLFLDDGLTAVPVLDVDGRPIGLVSKTDLLREVRDRGEIPDASLPTELLKGFHEDRAATTSAGDVMTPLVFAVLENATIAQAVPLMAFERVHHAPVVSLDGRVVGVLSSMDVLRWLSESLRSA